MSDKLVDALADIREDEAMEIAQAYLDEGRDPIEILEFARQAMDLVGERFAEGEYFLPELVMAGEMLNGITAMGRGAFYGMLQQTLPGHPPFQALPWRPSLHLAIFVHGVQGQTPGLYFLVRDRTQRDELQACLDASFLWQRSAGCPEGMDLFLLQEGDYRATAQAVSCGQEIASHGAFAVGMLAAYRDPMQQHGPWFYRRLHWEAGLIGQVLYLAAEAAGLRATGIGCFFDDSMHQVLGLAGYRTPGDPDTRYQILYHFTVGGPVEDPRLQTLDAYQHWGE